MSFLAPWAAIVAAAVAIPLLVSLYLLKLRRRPLRVSSTLLWTKAVHDLQVNVPFKWLRPTWMFMLQLVALGCLIAAIGRPALDASGGEASRVVLVIDRSASMSAVDAEVEGRLVSRLEAAKAKALDEVEAISRRGASTSVAVVAFAAEARMVTPLTQSLGDVREAIRSITASDQPGDVATAARVVSALVRRGEAEEVEGGAEPADVVLFGDGGGRSAGVGATVRDGRVRFVRTGPAMAIDGPALDNVGLTAIAARRDFEDPGTVRVFVRIASAGGAREVSLVLEVDGVEIDRRAALVPAAGSDAGETFALTTREAGVVTVRIDAAEDALASDDSASVVLSAATRPRVVIVTPDDRRDGAEWVLPVALRAMGLPVRAMPAAAFERDAASGAAVNAELVVFDGVRPRAMPGVATLTFGAGLPGLDARPAPDGTRFLAWTRGHPVLRNVALDAVYVARPLVVAERASDERLLVRELARGADGPLIVEVEDRGLRRLVVGFDLNQSNWPVQLTFPIFLASAVDYLTLRGEEESGRAFTTVQAARVEAAGTVAPPSGVMMFDGPVEIEGRVDEEVGGRVAVNLGVVERAGVYRARGASDAVADGAVVAVNLVDASESAIALGEGPGVVGGAGDVEVGGRGSREIWPWLVVAAVVLLSVEWVLNGWRMRV